MASSDDSGVLKAVAGVGLLGAVAASAYIMGKSAANIMESKERCKGAVPAPKLYTTGEAAAPGTRDALENVSPLDGRYASGSQVASPYFSEFGLIKYRVRVEVEYFIALCEAGIPELAKFDLSEENKQKLRAIYTEFTLDDGRWVKNKEKITNHDVKAVEYFIKDKFTQYGWEEYMEFIHFALTSQDINNSAVPLALAEFVNAEYVPTLNGVVGALRGRAKDYAEVTMLAKTHGQPATPTRLGKEFMVFVERIEDQLELLQHIPFTCKFGGASGGFNAHHVAYPEFNWETFADDFISVSLPRSSLLPSLKMKRQRYTTQIEHYDKMGAVFDTIKRINTILIDLCRDVWQYISMGYFTQKTKAGEVGSSAMPHKVNPIDFENGEGNLGMANCIFEHLSAKLPISRLQRDLSDSTVTRNISVPFCHSIIALKSISRGLGKLLLNEKRLVADLEDNWAVVAEAYQTILRRNNYEAPYEALKKHTRGAKGITKASMHAFIDEELTCSEAIKEQLRQISPHSFNGVFVLDE